MFIWWVNGRSPGPGTPMRGGFDSDRGLFYGEDKGGDLPINVRFIRIETPPNQERWKPASRASAPE